MKKIITILLAVVILSAMLVPVSAATEEELLTEFKKISISRHLLTEIENLAATYDITPEQGDKLMPLLKRAQEVFPEDLGPGYRNPEGHESYFGEEIYPYTPEQHNEMMNIITEACDILGFTYDFRDSYLPMHNIDLVFVVRDTDGRVIFEYDGDLIKRLGDVEEEESSSAPYLFGGISVSLLAGVAVAALKFRKKEQD